MTAREKLIQDMAMEIERVSVGSAEYWTEEQLQCWCFQDRYDVKSFARALVKAEAALAVVEYSMKKVF